MENSENARKLERLVTTESKAIKSIAYSAVFILLGIALMASGGNRYLHTESVSSIITSILGSIYVIYEFRKLVNYKLKQLAAAKLNLAKFLAQN